jgi:hypothetical protein
MQVLEDKFVHYTTNFGNLYIAGRINLEVSKVSSSLDSGKFPENLRGNFALIYISPTVTCFAVDHFATVPLFYTEHTVGTYFKDVYDSVQSPTSNDFIERVIRLHGGYSLGSQTNINEINRVEPCTYVWNGTVHNYIDIFEDGYQEFDKDKAIDVLKTAVARCSGEENAVFLSGGKDSSTLLGCMLEWGYNVNTISLHSRHQLYSEKKIVERLDEAYGTNTNFVEIEYSGKILGEDNEQFFSFWIENPFGAKRFAVDTLDWRHKTFITGEGGPLVFNHKMPLTYALQKGTIEDYCRLLAIDTMWNHQVASADKEYVDEKNHDVLDFVTQEYVNVFNNFNSDIDITNRLIHLQTVDTCCYRNFAYSQDKDITWTHPYFDWDFVKYVCGLEATYKTNKNLYKEAYGDYISLIPWEYPKNGLSIPTKHKHRSS